MSKYGKALSTYKKINKIKRSAEKIQEAQNIIGEQNAKAMQKAKDLQIRRGIAGSIGEAVVTAGAVGMSKSNAITPETAKKITTGANIASEGVSSLFGRVDSGTAAGLTRDQSDAFSRENSPDFLNAGVAGYAMQDNLERIRKISDFNKVKESLEDNQYGFSVDEMAPYMDEIEFQKGKGYDFSRLPSITQEKLRRLKIAMGQISDNPLLNEDEENQQDLFNNFSNNLT